MHSCFKDSTGLKITISLERLSNRWANKRVRCITLHPSPNTDKIIESRISITSEASHDATQFHNLISGQEKRVYTDKAYDSRNIFNLLRNNGTDAIIPLRKNFSTSSRGSPPTGKSARAVRNMETIVEGKIFLKIDGGHNKEIIRPRKPGCMIQEVGLKVLNYNMIGKLRQDAVFIQKFSRCSFQH